MGRPIKKEFFGIPSPGGKQIACEAWVNGDTQARVGYIVRQEGSESYTVTTAGGTGICWLVDNITHAGQMRVQVVAEGFLGTFYARKITDREVYTWDEKYFPYWNPVNGQIVYGTLAQHQYYIAAYGDITADSVNDISEGICFDSVGNLYVCGGKDWGGTGQVGYVTKIAADGALVWQKALSGTGATFAEVIIADSSDNLYVAVSETDASPNGSTILVKMSTDGVIVWQRKLVNFGSAFDIDTRNDGSTAVVGNSTNGQFVVAKYDTNGTIQFQKSIGDANTYATFGAGVAFTASDNVAVSMVNLSSSPQGLNLVALDNTGAISWQKKLTPPTDVDCQISALDSDAGGNLYVQSFTFDSNIGTYEGFNAKFSPTGTELWQKTYGIPDNTGFYAPFSIVSDANGSTWSGGYGYDPSLSSISQTLMNLDTNGNIVVQRLLLSASSLDTYGNVGNRDVATKGTHVALAGYGYKDNVANNYDAIIANVPADGSKTGMYGIFTYAESNFGNLSVTFSSGSITLPITSAGLVEQAGSLSISAFNYEIAFTDLA